MSRFIDGIVIAAAPMLFAFAGSGAPPAVASPNCMTLEEARKAFPGDHLHWHGPNHCWDNVGKGGRAKPAADAKAADVAPASSAREEAQAGKTSDLKPVEAGTPRRSAARAPAVPFIADDPIRVMSWSTAAPSVPVQSETSPAPAVQQEPAPEADATIVVGAPNAAPGSPDYLLEHCCWPPTVPEQAANSALLPRMVIASAGACGLAAGLWYFIYRRRRPRLHRVNAAPSIFSERNLFQRGMVQETPSVPHDLNSRREPDPPISTLAMYAPKRGRVAADHRTA